MPWTQVVWDYLFSADRKVSTPSAITIVAFWVFVAWSFGAIPAWGSGFAKASDVKAIKVSLLEAAILEDRIRYCSAPDGTDVKAYFSSQTQTKIRIYRDSTGSSFHLPPCKDLVYVAAKPTDVASD